MAFFDELERKLKIVDVNSGTVRNLCDVPGNQMAGSWSDEGHIVFASAGTGGIRRISANGGSTAQVTTLAAGEQSHLWPDLLPDSQHFVYLVAGGAQPGIYLGSLSGQAPRRLIDSTFMARVAPPNHLLYVRGDSLVSQEFDSSTLDLVGEPAPMVDSIMRTPAGRVAISASRRGDIVYTTGDFAADTAELVWISRTGVIDVTVPPVPTGGTGQRLSGDGKTLAYARFEEAASRIWIQDMGRRVSSRLASEPGTSDTSPAFSPDGLQVYYRRESGQGKAVIQRQPVSGVSAAVTVLSAPQSELVMPVDVTADGQRLLVIATRRQQRSLFVQPLTGGGPPMAYHEGSTATIGNAALSPDNLLVALSAGQVGQPQIFLQTFPDPTGGRWPVSGPGGAHPRWRSDGRELFFVDQQRWVNAVAVTSTKSAADW